MEEAADPKSEFKSITPIMERNWEKINRPFTNKTAHHRKIKKIIVSIEDEIEIKVMIMIYLA